VSAPALPAGSAPSAGRRHTPTYTAVNLWMLAFGIGICLGGGLLVIAGQGPIFEGAAVLFLVAVLLSITVRTVVTVERHGVRASLGLFGFPRRFIGMDSIVRARVVHVRPLRDFGGWGDRFLGHATRAYVSRRGEALRLELQRGAAFEVTIDGARRAADRVNAIVSERQPRPPGASPRERPRRRPVAPWF